MTVNTSKGKVPHIYKELIRRIITFEYKKLLLLKSLQNKVKTNIAITKQNKTSQTYYMPGAFWDKVLDFTDEPVVQWDFQAVKNTSLDNDNNDGRK